MTRKKSLVAIPVAALAIAGCGGSSNSQPSAQDLARKGSDALQAQVHQSQHNVEFRNYNWRQQVADDPATIVWCTFFPPGLQGVSNSSTPGQAFTVPIAGKLTSSNKRPYDSTSYTDAGNYSWYPTEVPGPDHMFGTSAEYRYGFGPTGKADYQDFTGLASYCTTEPKIWQAKTPIVASTSTTLQSIGAAASDAIRAGDAGKAQRLLATAEGKR